MRTQGPASPAGPRLRVANHVSWIDVLLLASVEPVCFLAKQEVSGWPIVATLARPQGAVFVDRRRRRLIPSANRAMADRLASGRSVLLFPEGMTFDGRRRGRFHTAHLACLRDRLARALAAAVEDLLHAAPAAAPTAAANRPRYFEIGGVPAGIGRSGNST